MNKNMSLGFWVNENLINTKRVFEQRIAAAWLVSYTLPSLHVDGFL
jgi:hypothetical protein